MNNNLEKTSTKQRILDSATELFATKGYTETTIRELAAVVGVKEASIYNHFPSKNAILESILGEYAEEIVIGFVDYGKISILEKNPTVDGIMSCMEFRFPEGREEYFLKQLYVILQEQHRNPTVRKFMCEQIILTTEHIFRTIVIKLKESRILRPDTDPDFWARINASLIYTFSSRRLLGIGDNAPDFSGKGLFELLRNVYGFMLQMCHVENDGITGAH